MQDEKAVAFQDINPAALRFQIIYLFIIIELFLVTVECFVFCLSIYIHCIDSWEDLETHFRIGVVYCI